MKLRLRLRISRRGQFMIMTSVIILISLMMLDKFVQETTFMEAAIPEREFSYHDAFVANAQRIVETAPPARFGELLGLLDLYSKKATTLQMEQCFCCYEDAPGAAACPACESDSAAEWGQDSGCQDMNTSSIENMHGTFRIQSTTVRIQSDIDLSASVD